MHWHAFSGDALRKVAAGAWESSGRGEWNRLYSEEQFTAPARITFWVEWHRNLQRSGPEYLGFHAQWWVDNDNNYDLGIRHDGHAGWLQEYQHQYTQLSRWHPHAWRPDGTRHWVSVTLGTDWLRATLDGRPVDEEAGAHHRFPRFKHARLGLRIDRQVVRIGGVRIASQEFIVSRIAGDSRYHTAVELSRRRFPDGAEVVYLTSGESFADALVAKFDDGPTLLTARDTLPDVTAEEIRRLRPKEVLVIGGTGVVSPAVQAAAEGL